MAPVVYCDVPSVWSEELGYDLLAHLLCESGLVIFNFECKVVLSYFWIVSVKFVVCELFLCVIVTCEYKDVRYFGLSSRHPTVSVEFPTVLVRFRTPHIPVSFPSRSCFRKKNGSRNGVFHPFPSIFTAIRTYTRCTRASHPVPHSRLHHAQASRTAPPCPHVNHSGAPAATLGGFGRPLSANHQHALQHV
jgi:hypothetical protein